MKRNNKLIYIFTGVLAVLILAGCGVPAESITLNTPKELVSRMNNDFEGKFTYVSDETNEKDKSVVVIMSCVVDGKTLEVKVTEKHKVDAGEFGTYFTKDGSFYTNYYSARYGDVAKEKLKDLVNNHFESISQLSGYKIIAEPDTNITTLTKFKNVDEYVDYLKKNGHLGYKIVVPFGHEENTDFELLVSALAGERENGTDFCWVNLDSYIIYDKTHKVTDDILSLDDREMEDKLLKMGVDFEYLSSY